MLNTITIMGRLTRDPELRKTASGISLALFSVAVDRDYVSQGQERGVDFIDCKAWRGTADFISRYFHKGSMIVIKGRLEIDRYTANDGSNRRAANVVVESAYFGSSKKEQDPPASAPAYAQAPVPVDPDPLDYYATLDGDEALPF